MSSPLIDCPARSGPAFSLACSLALLTGSVAAQVATTPVPGPLARHVQLEQWVASLPESEQVAMCAELALHPGHLDRVMVAFYTPARLSAADQENFSTRGIQMVPDLFIPPIPGRHALGYHLADVPHSELAQLALSLIHI